MEDRSVIPTCSALREEWGLERYTKALGIVSGYIVQYGLHMNMMRLTELSNNRDALDVYGAIIMHGVNS